MTHRPNPWRLAPHVGFTGLILSLLPLACSAPVSRPAEGPISTQIQAAIENGQAGFDHGEWDRLLGQGTRDGLVDYDYFQAHRAELDGYLERVAEAELELLSRDHLMALLINAYNAYTILSILDRPEVASIRDIDGVWSKATHRVGGFELTLDQIEHNLLRPYFKDPRIHVAVNCASMSCAPLPPWAFDGEQLEEQLDSWTRAFFRDPDNVRLEGQELRLSRLLDWYGADFISEGWRPRADTLLDFVARYAEPEVAAVIQANRDAIEIAFFTYDWSLNRAS